jgi:hypothetical protein
MLAMMKTKKLEEIPLPFFKNLKKQIESRKMFGN